MFSLRTHFAHTTCCRSRARRAPSAAISAPEQGCAISSHRYHQTCLCARCWSDTSVAPGTSRYPSAINETPALLPGELRVGTPARGPRPRLGGTELPLHLVLREFSEKQRGCSCPTELNNSASSPLTAGASTCGFYPHAPVLRAPRDPALAAADGEEPCGDTGYKHTLFTVASKRTDSL